MVHIFSQWGSLMCEQGSGRSVNRGLYEAARGELGCQWRGLSHVCHVATLGPGACLFWWQHETGVTAGLVYIGYVSGSRVQPRHEKMTSWIASELQVWDFFQSRLVESHLLLYWNDRPWQMDERRSYYKTEGGEVQGRISKDGLKKCWVIVLKLWEHRAQIT